MHPLKAARAKAGLTQLQLAARSGVSIATISQAENARRIPYPAHRQAIAHALGVWHESIWPEPTR